MVCSILGELEGVRPIESETYALVTSFYTFVERQASDYKFSEFLTSETES